MGVRRSSSLPVLGSRWRRWLRVGRRARGGRRRRRCVRLCGEPRGEAGFSFAECFEAVTVAADVVLEEVGREPSLFEAFEVAF